MKTEQENVDTGWSARKPIAVGLVALVVFACFMAIWAGKDTVSGDVYLRGFVVDADDQGHIVITLDPAADLRPVPLGAPAKVLVAGSDTGFEGKIVRMNPSDPGVQIKLDQDLPRNILVSPGQAVSIAVLAENRSPLSVLLAPISAHFRGPDS